MSSLGSVQASNAYISSKFQNCINILKRPIQLNTYFQTHMKRISLLGLNSAVSLC